MRAALYGRPMRGDVLELTKVRPTRIRAFRQYGHLA
jgi:hypothetical protein